MAKVEIDVEPGYQAYLLCYKLADVAQDYTMTAARWGENDAVRAALDADAAFFNTVAKAIARQVALVIKPPVEPGKDTI